MTVADRQTDSATERQAGLSTVRAQRSVHTENKCRNVCVCVAVNVLNVTNEMH